MRRMVFSIDGLKQPRYCDQKSIVVGTDERDSLDSVLASPSPDIPEGHASPFASGALESIVASWRLTTDAKACLAGRLAGHARPSPHKRVLTRVGGASPGGLRHMQKGRG